MNEVSGWLVMLALLVVLELTPLPVGCGVVALAVIEKVLLALVVMFAEFVMLALAFVVVAFAVIGAE